MLCELCEAEEAFNFHHFIPKTLHSNRWFKARYTRLQLSDGIDVCKQCHKAIHEYIPKEKDIGRRFNTLALLLEHPEIAKYVAWKRRKVA